APSECRFGSCCVSVSLPPVLMVIAALDAAGTRTVVAWVDTRPTTTTVAPFASGLFGRLARQLFGTIVLLLQNELVGQVGVLAHLLTQLLRHVRYDPTHQRRDGGDHILKHHHKGEPDR